MSNAAFINALIDEGTKHDCLEKIVKLWDENCELRNAKRRALAIADERVKEANELRRQLVQAKNALFEIQELGATAPPNTLACQLGNIAHAARLILPDDHGEPK